MTWNKKTLNWSFTEYKVVDLHLGLTLDGLPNGLEYIVYQLEQCPSTGRDHIQGYARLLLPRTRNWMRHNLSMTAVFEPVRKTEPVMLSYVTKEKTRRSGPYYWGISPEQVVIKKDIINARRELVGKVPL